MLLFCLGTSNVDYSVIEDDVLLIPNLTGDLSDHFGFVTEELLVERPEAD